MEIANLCDITGAQVIAEQDLPDAITGMIQKQIARLKREYSYILDGKVSVSVPAFYHSGTYLIQILLTLPQEELKIDRSPIPDYYQEDIYVAIWSAFDLARKKLGEFSTPTNGDTPVTPIQKVPHQSIRTIRRCRGYAQG